ncbi:MAG: hypothetical protein IT431_04435 [Phycisphaerales bacterium]|nr:hypothetical protein [Phycisphaerales bacterium]
MKTRTLLCALFALVLTIVLMIVLARARITSYERGMYVNRLDAALAELNTGRVVLGSEIPNVWYDNAKPMTDVVYAAPDGRRFYLWGYTSDYRSLHVYLCEGRVFAAHLVEGIRTSKDTWHFCDRALYDEYLALAAPQPTPPTGTP